MIKIKCDFDLCIYNKSKECNLEIITVSATGVCDDCILPDFSADLLKSHKKITLDKIEHAKKFDTGNKPVRIR